MEPLFFVMAIMGCGDAGSACSEARIVPVQYTSFAACQEAMPAMLERNTDLSYPELDATCRASGPRWVQNHAGDATARG